MLGRSASVQAGDAPNTGEQPFPKRPLLIIFVIIVVNLLGFGIIIPLLPFYASALNASPFTIGLIFAAYSLCQLIASPILGEMSDRHGRRPVLLFSLAGTVVSFILLALAHAVPMLFVARIVDGLSGGNISTARAYIADVTAPEQRAKAYGLIGAGFGLGFILGPALGGLLGGFGYAVPAWAAAVLALLAAVLTWFWLPETRHLTSAKRGSPWKELPRMIGRPRIGPLLGIDFCYWAAFAVYQTTFALFVAERFKFDVTATGMTFAFVGVIGVLVQVKLVGAVVERFGEGYTLAIGLALAGLGLLAVALVQAVVPFFAALVPAAIGMGLSSPSLTSLLSRSVEADEQGRLQGVSGALESLGRTVGPLWGNGMLEALGEGIAYGSAALVLLLISAWSARVASLRRTA
jgi:DHA1 family tetracycline resistance protein-like MFS transporter